MTYFVYTLFLAVNLSSLSYYLRMILKHYFSSESNFLKKNQPVQLNDLNLPIEKMQSSQGTELENLHLFHKYNFYRSLMQLQKMSLGKIETSFISICNNYNVLLNY